MIYALKIIWDNLIVILLVLLAIICMIKEIDFKSKISFYDSDDNSQCSFDKEYNNYTTDNNQTFVSPYTKNYKNEENYQLFFIDEIVNTESDEYKQKYENNKIYKIKRSKSSASELNEYLKTDNDTLHVYSDPNKLYDFQSEESLLESQSGIILKKLSICVKCRKQIVRYYSKAYYRFSDNSICEQCYDRLKNNLKLSK